MYARAARTYKQIDLESAPKVQILDRLYARLLRDLEEARDAITARDVKRRAQAIDHAARIITELRAALDFSVAADLCENLASLYGFAEDRLFHGHLHQDSQALGEAAAVIANLREAFAEAAKRV